MYTEKIISFLEEIGISVAFCQLEATTFLPGITIQEGKICIDKEKLSYPGDILHEAGHLAVRPASLRASSVGDDFANDGEEIGAILWSFAAAHHLGLPLDFVFHENGYKGQAGWLIESFQQGTYIGLPLLEWMGLTASKEKAKQLQVAPFPKMLRWLRD
ncbi:MAG: hypothetical protein ACKVTZ_06935 [Bacteroidia bacterium]